jgi:hypothetical protein
MIRVFSSVEWNLVLDWMAQMRSDSLADEAERMRLVASA